MDAASPTVLLKRRPAFGSRTACVSFLAPSPVWVLYSGSIPSSLGSLRRLRELELSHNRFSGSLPARVAHWGISLEHFDLAKNPRLTGVPKQQPKQGCSGGAEKYLRGQQPGQAAQQQQQRPDAAQLQRADAGMPPR